MVIVNFPKAIEIMTTSFCNANCVICPHKKVSQKLPMGIMSMDLFKKILSEINNKKTLLIPYLNGEPFLDPHFFERLDLIKKHCPNVKLEISTNLSVFTPEKIDKLCNYNIDELRLSVFGFTPETYHRIMPGLNWNKTKKNLDYLVKSVSSFNKVGIVMVLCDLLKEEDILLAEKYCRKHKLTLHKWGFLDRGGNVENYYNKVKAGKIVGCSQNREIERLHVLFNGEVILCCQDWGRKYILGDLKTSTNKQIWNSKPYEEIRESIHHRNKKAPKICEKCVLAKKL